MACFKIVRQSSQHQPLSAGQGTIQTPMKSISNRTDLVANPIPSQRSVGFHKTHLAQPSARLKISVDPHQPSNSSVQIAPVRTTANRDTCKNIIPPAIASCILAASKQLDPKSPPGSQRPLHRSNSMLLDQSCDEIRIQNPNQNLSSCSLLQDA